MPVKAEVQKKRKAFRLRLEKMSFADIATKLKISTTTLCRWENGWVDKKGNRHNGWKLELGKLMRDSEDEELKSGMMLKKKRLQTYDRLAQLAMAKIESQFPELTMKSFADLKALMSEIRELCRLIAIETGQYKDAENATFTVKRDITLVQLEERYKQTLQHKPGKAEEVVEAETVGNGTETDVTAGDETNE